MRQQVPRRGAVGPASVRQQVRLRGDGRSRYVVRDPRGQPQGGAAQGERRPSQEARPRRSVGVAFRAPPPREAPKLREEDRRAHHPAVHHRRPSERQRPDHGRFRGFQEPAPRVRLI